MTTSNRRFPTVLCLALAMLAAPVVAFAQDATTQPIEPKAEQALRRVADFYKGIDSATTHVVVDGKADLGGMSRSMTGTFDMALERPNKLSLKPENVQEIGRLTSNGKTMWASVPVYSKYVEQDAPEGLDEMTEYAAAIAGPAGMGPAVVGTLFAEEPFDSLMEGVTGLRHLGTEDLNGQPHEVVELVQNDMNAKVYIQQGDRPLVSSVQADMSKQLRAAGQDEGTMTMAVNMTDWQVNPHLGDDQFTFEPQAGHEKVASLRALFGMEEEPQSALLGKPAPDFTLDLLEGGQLTLSQHKGKEIVILDFWATWCGPCIQAMPVLIEVSKQYADKNVVFYAVDLQEEPEQIRAFLQEHKFELKVPMDKDGKVSEMYGVTGIPQTVIVGKDGTVQAVHVGFGGASTKRTLTKELDKLTSGESLVETASN